MKRERYYYNWVERLKEEIPPEVESWPKYGWHYLLSSYGQMSATFSRRD